MDPGTAINNIWNQRSVMVKKYILILFLTYLIHCPAEPPTGPETDIDNRLTLNCIINPKDQNQKIYLSRWYRCSEHYDESEECHEESNYETWSVKGANIEISIDSVEFMGQEVCINQSDRYRYGYTTYYQFLSPEIKPGQKWEIEVIHPDFNKIYASAVIPDSVLIIKPVKDTLNLNCEAIDFEWTLSEYGYGFLPRLYLFAIYEGRVKLLIELLPYFNVQERVGIDPSPSRKPSIKYSTKSIYDQIYDYFNLRIENGWITIEDIKQYNGFYLRLEVFSMNEALYHVLRYEYKPDELSGFNAPIQIFTNVKNGGGILGAYWVTTSKEIFIDKELIYELFDY